MIGKDKDKKKLTAKIAKLHQQVADLVASKYKLQKESKKFQASRRRFRMLTKNWPACLVIDFQNWWG